jgi:pyruvate dehydrogenase E2 component (dihydrolipoamide acetyltransferase)
LVVDVVLPQMGLEVSEGTVTAILVQVGDTVAEGATVAEVETDKAIAEVAASRPGVVTAVEIEVGDVIAVGQTMVRIGDSAEDTGAAAPASADAEAAADVEAASAETQVPVAAPPTAGANGVAAESPNGAHRRRAAPIARRAAAEHGLDLDAIDGSGPAGRITLADVERAVAAGSPANGAGTTAASPSAAAATSPAAPAPAAPGAPALAERIEPLTATRQAIARRLAESQLVPSYTLSRDVDVAWLLAEKTRLTKSGPIKVGVVDLLVQTLAETLVRHPQLAASFLPASDGELARLRHPAGIDIGMAVATDRGLLVPVMRDVHTKALPELVLERSRLIETTRSGRLGLADMGGAAATLSSLGTFGVDSFTAMLNPGESSILAVGRTVDKVVPRDRGLAVVPTLTLTFTFDHRVVDGAAGAAALAAMAELLEGSMEWRT